MSGELDERPDLTALLRNLRDRVYELEHRISGDTNPLSLNDLEDVRVDSLGDVTITLADGDALIYRAADELWVPGTASGGSLITDSYYEFIDDGTTTGNLYTAGDVANTWDLVSAFSNGSDVSLSSGVVTIDTTGVYSIAATWELKADSAADTYTYARGRFTLDRVNEPGSPAHDQVFLDDVKPPAVNPSDDRHIASFAVAVTAFMYAGDQIVTEGRFSAAASPASNWSFLTASMYVERLA